MEFISFFVLLRHTEEYPALCNEFFLVPIAQKTIVSDLRESVGKDVQKEAPDTFVSIEGHHFCAVPFFRISIAEGDGVVVYGYQTIVGNGYPMGVSPKIVEDLSCASEGLFAVESWSGKTRQVHKW